MTTNLARIYALDSQLKSLDAVYNAPDNIRQRRLNKAVYYPQRHRLETEWREAWAKCSWWEKYKYRRSIK